MPGVTKPAGATRWKGEGTIWVILVQGAEKGRDRRIVCEMLIQKPRDPTAVEKNCAGMARLLFMRDNLSSLPPHVRIPRRVRAASCVRRAPRTSGVKSAGERWQVHMHEE
jgi:hypothetical protein